MLLADQFFEQLSTDVAVSGLVGTRITPDVADVDTDKPCLIYSYRYEVPDAANIDRPIPLDRWTFTVNVYGESAADASDTAAAVRSCLDGWSGGQVQSCTFLSEDSSFNDFGYLREQSYQIWAYADGLVATSTN